MHISMMKKIDSSSQRDEAGTKEKDHITKYKKLSVAEY